MKPGNAWVLLVHYPSAWVWEGDSYLCELGGDTCHRHPYSSQPVPSVDMEDLLEGCATCNGNMVGWSLYSLSPDLAKFSMSRNAKRSHCGSAARCWLAGLARHVALTSSLSPARLMLCNHAKYKPAAEPIWSNRVAELPSYWMSLLTSSCI